MPIHRTDVDDLIKLRKAYKNMKLGRWLRAVIVGCVGGASCNPDLLLLSGLGGLQGGMGGRCPAK